MSEEKSLADRWTERLKNHPFIALIVVAATIVGWISPINEKIFGTKDKKEAVCSDVAASASATGAGTVIQCVSATGIYLSLIHI